MSEQTANLCTTDACESLRARLAKYEDAEGRPLRAVVLPEPMKRGDEGGSGEYGAAMIRGYSACLREVARLNSSPVSSAPSHGEQVPTGWKLVPMEATTGMVEALKARISCTSRGGILNAGNALNDAIAAAPSAGSQEQGE